ncbi:anaphase-promoting complex subunit Hcn1 [Cichlidogyrus casuarinus]|uniref:Anaphase-promoting complex subunit Hcn1 n=1 Tax=Cichlidogyrus casuarinus TaxID=1844966 RepID=A0ABD2Q1W2_9PLAT
MQEADKSAESSESTRQPNPIRSDTLDTYNTTISSRSSQSIIDVGSHASPLRRHVSVGSEEVQPYRSYNSNVVGLLKRRGNSVAAESRRSPPNSLIPSDSQDLSLDPIVPEEYLLRYRSRSPTPNRNYAPNYLSVKNSSSSRKVSTSSLRNVGLFGNAERRASHSLDLSMALKLAESEMLFDDTVLQYQDSEEEKFAKAVAAVVLAASENRPKSAITEVPIHMYQHHGSEQILDFSLRSLSAARSYNNESRRFNNPLNPVSLRASSFSVAGMDDSERSREHYGFYGGNNHLIPTSVSARDRSPCPSHRSSFVVHSSAVPVPQALCKNNAKSCSTKTSPNSGISLHKALCPQHSVQTTTSPPPVHGTLSTRGSIHSKAGRFLSRAASWRHNRSLQKIVNSFSFGPEVVNKLRMGASLDVEIGPIVKRQITENEVSGQERLRGNGSMCVSTSETRCLISPEGANGDFLGVEKADLVLDMENAASKNCDMSTQTFALRRDIVTEPAGKGRRNCKTQTEEDFFCEMCADGVIEMEERPVLAERFGMDEKAVAQFLLHSNGDPDALNDDVEEDPSDNKGGSASTYLKEQFLSFFQPSDNKLAMKLFGNKHALNREKNRLRQQGKWIIHPYSTGI